MGTYCEQPVNRALARWVECIWHIESRERIDNVPVRPDGCIDLIYSPMTDC